MNKVISHCFISSWIDDALDLEMTHTVVGLMNTQLNIQSEAAGVCVIRNGCTTDYNVHLVFDDHRKTQLRNFREFNRLRCENARREDNAKKISVISCEFDGQIPVDVIVFTNLEIQFLGHEDGKTTCKVAFETDYTTMDDLYAVSDYLNKHIAASGKELTAIDQKTFEDCMRLALASFADSLTTKD